MLAENGPKQALAILGRCKKVMRIFGAELLRRRFSRSDGDCGGGVGSAAADVVNRVPDDDYIAAAKAIAAALFGAMHADRRQLVATRCIATERAEAKGFVARRPAQLQAAADLDPP